MQQLIRHTSGIPDFMESGKFDVFDFTTVTYAPIDLVKAALTAPGTASRDSTSTPTPTTSYSA